MKRLKIYKVTLSINHHYGNGNIQRGEESQSIIAEDGEAAVAKAKTVYKHAEPRLEGLQFVLDAAV